MGQVIADEREKAARKRKVSPMMSLVERAKRDDKPTLAQWFKLKQHIEHHFYRSRWAFPQGVSFLTWRSGLRPYLSQRTMKEEMNAPVIATKTMLSAAMRHRAPRRRPLCRRRRSTLTSPVLAAIVAAQIDRIVI